MVANIVGPDLGFIILIALVVLVGGSQLPKIARNVGLAGKEFRKAQAEAEAEETAREQAAQAARASTDPGGSPSTPPTPLPLGSGPGSSVPGAQAEEKVTLTRAELDALLKAREEQAKNTAEGPTATS